MAPPTPPPPPPPPPSATATAFFQAEASLDVPDTDLLSWMFDAPSYDLNRTVLRHAPTIGPHHAADNMAVIHISKRSDADAHGHGVPIPHPPDGKRLPRRRPAAGGRGLAARVQRCPPYLPRPNTQPAHTLT